MHELSSEPLSVLSLAMGKNGIGYFMGVFYSLKRDYSFQVVFSLVLICLK